MSRSSGIVRGIAMAVVAAGLAACSTPGASAHLHAAAPASPSTVPVRVQPNVVGWSGMAERPARIYVGMGGAPVVVQLAWRSWGGPRAQAVGKLDIYRPQSGPISGWHPTTYRVTVRLQDIVTRNGQASYREMEDFYVSRGGAAKELAFTFSVLSGGTLPSWNPARPSGQAALTAAGAGASWASQ